MPRIANTSWDKKVSVLYLKNLSAPLIAHSLDIPLDRVYASLRRQKIPRRSGVAQRKIRFEQTPLSFKFRKTFSQKQRELLVAGIMLYYGEGAKTGNTVDLANSDLGIHKIFLRFLREICGVAPKKLRFYLYCFTDQNQKKLTDFWSKNLKVPKRNFTKPYVRQASQNNQRTTPYGVLHIRYSDKRLLQKLLELSFQITNSLI